MARNCIGLDIGSSSIKVVQAKETSRGVQLVNFGIEPLPTQTIVDGAIMNQAAVIDAIRALRAKVGFRSRDVATAISGHSVIIKKIQVPQMTPEELEEQIPWEAEHHIPFSRDDVEIDHQVVTTENAAGQMEIMLVAAKKEVVADYAQVVREAKLNPVVMDVAAFTVQNAFEASYAATPGETVVLINIGAAISNINVLLGGTSTFTRDITVGGDAFTEEIQKRLSISQEEAEAYKIGSGGPEAHELVPQEVDGIFDGDGRFRCGKIPTVTGLLSGRQRRCDHFPHLLMRRISENSCLADVFGTAVTRACGNFGSVPPLHGGPGKVRHGVHANPRARSHCGRGAGFAPTWGPVIESSSSLPHRERFLKP